MVLKSSAIPLAVGALVLSALMDLTGSLIAQPPAMGMRGIVNDPYEVPVRMTGQATACPGYVLASNLLQQTDHGRVEGYFAVGEGFEGMMRPEDHRYNWVLQFRNQPVDIVLRVRGPRQLERVK